MASTTMAFADGVRLAGVAGRGAGARGSRAPGRAAPFAVPVGLGARQPASKACSLRLSERLRPVSASAEDEKTPTPYDEDLPPWARNESGGKKADDEDSLPFGVYLLFSAIVAIAAVGSIFEWVNQNPVFGLIQPDSFLYTPVLGFFAVTGLPTAGVLFKKSIDKANALSAKMDAQDGYD